MNSARHRWAFHLEHMCVRTFCRSFLRCVCTRARECVLYARFFCFFNFILAHNAFSIIVALCCSLHFISSHIFALPSLFLHIADAIIIGLWAHGYIYYIYIYRYMCRVSVYWVCMVGLSPNNMGSNKCQVGCYSSRCSSAR